MDQQTRKRKKPKGIGGGCFPKKKPRSQLWPRDWYKYLTLPLICTVAYYVYIGYRESRVKTPFVGRPLVVQAGLNEPERLWGTYRPLTYFGLKTRDPKSAVMGLMWHSSTHDHRARPEPLRHWCEQHRLTYGWTQHDGRTFGNQKIEDYPFAMNTSFVKYASDGQYGGDWTARIAVHNPHKLHGATISLIWYVAIEDLRNERIRLLGGTGTDGKLPIVYGETASLGRFKLTFNVHRGSILDTSYLSTVVSGLDKLQESVEQYFRWTKSKDGREHRKLPGEIVSANGVRVTETPNFIALQLLADAPFSVDICYQSLVDEPVPQPLLGKSYTDALKTKLKEFDARFERTYGLQAKGYSADELQFAKHALSNLLGGIGYFYGASVVLAEHASKPVPYWRAPLYTAVPSRSFFPRGFLWDEGFHGLLISSWDLDIELDIICHWFDLLNTEGWIPREQILGVEALARVPAEFVTQRSSNANPPTFFLTLHKIWSDHYQLLLEEKRFRILERLFPRLDAWFAWFNTTQRGEMLGTYLWRGRNASTEFELNPKSLSSGLDDYPRATHPTGSERHVDLLCWLGFAAKVMSNLAELLNRKPEKYHETELLLNSNEFINSQHLNDLTGNYEDWGLHSDAVTLVASKTTKDNMQRRVLKPPSYKFVHNVYGYVNLFPFLLQQLNSDSPHLTKILRDLRNPKLLWTEFGLRSLSKSSSYYMKRNTKHDPPYWRGQIWINMNYLAVRALHHYGKTEDSHPNALLAREIYVELRRNVIANIFGEYRRTGFIWEQYDDQTGRGRGSHPFTGWSSLVVLLMAERY